MLHTNWAIRPINRSVFSESIAYNYALHPLLPGAQFWSHKNVGTPEDPSTARRGEWVYTFWLRSILFSYLSAWRIGIQRSKGNLLKNEMVHYSLVQLALIAIIFEILAA